jgi:regulator of cell morphogenesis and NO signaling
MIISPQNSAEHAKLGELIVHIEQSHHVFTRSELERIADILHAMKGAEMPVLAEIERCFAELRADLIPHLMKEERILFPYITALERDPAHPPSSCFGSIANPIRMMQAEHTAVITLLKKLRALTDEYRTAPDSDAGMLNLFAALAGLDGDLIQHIHWEDDVLFPQALQLESAATF